MKNPLPILYSFRRCPYAMRARLAIVMSESRVELREVVLKDRPKALYEASPKGTVPVLVLATGRVIDESLDIMTYFLEQNAPYNLLAFHDEALIQENDGEFKHYLDKYKYHDRFPENTKEYYRENGEKLLKKLEVLLKNNEYLFGGKISFTDIAILPFIRQFAHVDLDWFEASDYKEVQRWLEKFKKSHMFNLIMYKYDQWLQGHEGVIFPVE